MKKIISLPLYFLYLPAFNAQDTIIKANTKEFIICWVTALSPEKIFYTENGIGKSIPKNEVSYFSNHASVKMQVEEKPVKIKYKVVLSNKFAIKRKYDFSIFDIVDGRLNKAKPIGSLLNGFKLQYVGNDSLAESMNLFFENNRNWFDTTSRVVIVLNQLSLLYLGGYSMVTGKIEDFQMSVSMDYYKLNGNTCELIYQQRHKYTRSVKFIAKKTKAINLTYFETIESALDDFNSQLRSNKLITLKTIPLDALLNLYSTKTL